MQRRHVGTISRVHIDSSLYEQINAHGGLASSSVCADRAEIVEGREAVRRIWRVRRDAIIELSSQRGDVASGRSPVYG